MYTFLNMYILLAFLSEKSQAHMGAASPPVSAHKSKMSNVSRVEHVVPALLLY
jgi:hypothetical protein